MAIMKFQGGEMQLGDVYSENSRGAGGCRGGQAQRLICGDQGKLQRSCDVRVICDVFNDVSRFPTFILPYVG